MHITILALGSTGDILPYSALGSGLLDAGHQIRFITFNDFASGIKDLGMDHYPIQGDPKSLVSGGGGNIISMARSFGSLARGYARDLSDPLLLETDLFLNQLPASLYAYDLAEKASVPMMAVSVIPLAPTNQFPLASFPDLSLPGINKLTYFVGEWIVWMMFRKVIRQWRTETLKLPPVSRRDYLGSAGSPEQPILNGFSPAVVDKPPDWSEHIHITGYWYPEDPDWEPPGKLVEFIKNGPPPIFIGFGSMPVKNPQTATRKILEALERTGQRGILHAGWGGIGNQALPSTVLKIDYAPYQWLFPQMGMVIHHGGSGTTSAVLRSGVPSCAVPFMFDQIYWGKRIASLGVGPEPIGIRKLTDARLAGVIEQGLNDPVMRQKAQVLSKRIQAEDGIQRAVDLINEHLKNPNISR